MALIYSNANTSLIVPDHVFITPAALFVHSGGSNNAHCWGGGKIDTCIEMNVISADFFSQTLAPAGFSITLFPGGSRAIFRTINGIPVRAMGTLRALIKLLGPQWPAKFILDVKFYVLENPISDIDFILGRETFAQNVRLVIVGAPAQGAIIPPAQIVPKHVREQMAIITEAKAAEEAAIITALDKISIQNPPKNNQP